MNECVYVCVCACIEKVSSCPRKAWEAAPQQKCLKAKFPEPPLYEVIDIFYHFTDNFIERSTLPLSTCFMDLNQQFKNQHKSSTQTTPDCSVIVQLSFRLNHQLCSDWKWNQRLPSANKHLYPTYVWNMWFGWIIQWSCCFVVIELFMFTVCSVNGVTKVKKPKLKSSPIVSVISGLFWRMFWVWATVLIRAMIKILLWRLIRIPSLAQFKGRENWTIGTHSAPQH